MKGCCIVGVERLLFFLFRLHTVVSGLYSRICCVAVGTLHFARPFLYIGVVIGNTFSQNQHIFQARAFILDSVFAVCSWPFCRPFELFYGAVLLSWSFDFWVGLLSYLHPLICFSRSFMVLGYLPSFPYLKPLESTKNKVFKKLVQNQ